MNRYRPADLAREVPGSVNLFERYPRLIWVAAGFTWVTVLIVVRGVLAGAHL